MIKSAPRNTVIKVSFLLALCLSTTALPGTCNNIERNPVQDAKQWIKNNGASPKEMKPFAQKIAAMPVAQKQKIVAAIRPFLQSKKWEEQANAIYLLGYLGDSAAPVVPEIIKAMDAEMSNVAWEAPPALARIGSPAMPALIAALKAETPGTSKRIYNLTKCIKEIGPKALASAPFVVPFLDDGHNTGAIDALVSIGPSCLPAICQGFDRDTKGLIVVHAGYVFAKFGNAASTKAIINYLNGKCSEVGKKNAVCALARMKPAPEKIAVPVLCKILAEGKGDTLDNAEIALTAIGPSAAPDVLELASHREARVKESVQRIMRTYGANSTASNSSVQVLLNKLNTLSAEEAAESAATILKLAPDNIRAVAKLRQLLLSKKPGETRLALQALPKAESGGKALVPDLIKILKEGQTGQRILAADALGAIGSNAGAAVRPLIEAASMEHPIEVSGHEGFNLTSQVHLSSIIALGKIGPQAQSAISLFCKLLKDKTQNNLHTYVYSALAGMGASAEQAVPTIVECLKTYPNERVAIIDLLTKMGSRARGAESELRKLIVSQNDQDRSLKKKAYLALMAVQPDLTKNIIDTKTMLKTNDYELQEVALKHIIEQPSLAKDPEIARLLVKFMDGENYGLKQLTQTILARTGSTDDSILPKLINENIGCSFSPTQKDNAFATIKKMDPTGAKTIPLVQKALGDAFQVRGAVELLEFIGSPQTLTIARETRKRWKLE
ncbi:MAG: HEAT repeat domain-containing protein [Candidatus Obscuribacter sp.]|jgi:HEAT repeat protein|nr:HEAT repeat domain-containing protein [Candidatus Obscuribacter sp.]MDQ5965522.1 hypothetical protein [Cyanobacteriota bacterium erpe_2018_sw_39hr_WHONDRS-SW48-000098_B_bin.30]